MNFSTFYHFLNCNFVIIELYRFEFQIKIVDFLRYLIGGYVLQKFQKRLAISPPITEHLAQFEGVFARTFFAKWHRQDVIAE